MGRDTAAPAWRRLLAPAALLLLLAAALAPPARGRASAATAPTHGMIKPVGGFWGRGGGVVAGAKRGMVASLWGVRGGADNKHGGDEEESNPVGAAAATGAAAAGYVECMRM